jgi:hypothetical protein
MNRTARIILSVMALVSFGCSKPCNATVGSVEPLFSPLRIEHGYAEMNFKLKVPYVKSDSLGLGFRVCLKTPGFPPSCKDVMVDSFKKKHGGRRIKRNPRQKVIIKSYSFQVEQAYGSKPCVTISTDKCNQYNEAAGVSTPPIY